MEVKLRRCYLTSLLSDAEYIFSKEEVFKAFVVVLSRTIKTDNIVIQGILVLYFCGMAGLVYE